MNSKGVIKLCVLFLFVLTADCFSLDLPKLKLKDPSDKNFPVKFTLSEKFTVKKNPGQIDLLKDKIKTDFYAGGKKISLNLKSPEEYKPHESKKRFGLAVAEMAIIEFIPWAISKYITKPGWANVGFQSWWRNIEDAWEYDGDNFLTNNFAHPYHGNLYFNSARTNGYNFWESVPFSMSGSLIWEYFGEYYRPSFNDWINTSVSGINLGEMTYRLANKITDNKATGSSRMWKEIWGALINPVRGFNRLISGETHRVFANNNELKNHTFTLSVNAGMRRITRTGSDIAKDGVQEGILGFELGYGRLFEENLKTPFNVFNVWGAVSNGDSKLTDLHSYGTLTGMTLKENKKSKHLLALELAYDFMSNPAYEYGGPSVLIDLHSRFKMGKKHNLVTSAAARITLMGSTSTEYFYGEDGRDYDLGPGVGALLDARYVDKDWIYGSITYTQFWIFTMSGSPDSKHLLHYLALKGQYPINNYFALGLEASIHYRNSFYTDHDDLSRTSPILRLFFTTKL